jgi:hypothetical protein
LSHYWKLIIAAILVVVIVAVAVLIRPMVHNPAGTTNSVTASTASSQLASTTASSTGVSQTIVTYPIAYGVNFPWYMYGQVNNPLTSELHLKWIRTQFPYPMYQQDLIGLITYYHDSQILAMLAMGMMGGYRNQCKFTTSSHGASISSCEWTLSDWDEKVSQAVNTYPNVHVWEIWNEPEWYEGGYLCCDDNVTRMADHYFNMLRDAYKIIKTHNPSDIVIAFGGNTLNYWSPDNWDWIWQFTQQVWKLGAANYCDAISLHAYTHGYTYLLNETLWGVTGSQYWTMALTSYETLTGKPVWITETGLASNGGGVGQERQAAFLNQSFTFFSQLPYVKAVFWFIIEGNDNADLVSTGSDMGLITMGPLNQQTPKPAFYMFQAFSQISVTSLSLYQPMGFFETSPITDTSTRAHRCVRTKV